MLIYRVEHLLTGIGPYTGNDGAMAAVGQDTISDESHPMPEEDGIFSGFHERVMSPQYRYGFKSMTDLISWFPEDTLEALIGLGYVVATYRADREAVKFGRRHLAFDGNEAKQISLSDSLDNLAYVP